MKFPPYLYLVVSLPVLPVGAEIVYSEPAGFVKMGNTAADGETIPAVPANTDVRLTIPLDRELAHAGLIDDDANETDGTTITFQGTPGWTLNQWAPGGGETYCAIIGSGVQDGLRGLISGNDANSLTISSIQNNADLSQVAHGDTVEIRPCWTLGSFFADSDIPAGTQLFLFAGETPGQNISPNTTIFRSTTDWRILSDATLPVNTLVDDWILHPGESLMLRTLGTPVDSLVVFGDVPTSGHKAPIEKLETSVAQDTTIGYFSPVPETIGASGLGFTAGDQLLVFPPNDTAGLNKSALQILFYNGSNWASLLPFDNTNIDDTFLLQPGVGYVYRQLTGAAGTYDWSSVQSFRPVPAP